MKRIVRTFRLMGLIQKTQELDQFHPSPSLNFELFSSKKSQISSNKRKAANQSRLVSYISCEKNLKSQAATSSKLPQFSNCTPSHNLNIILRLICLTKEDAFH
ncbi:hypothetical protein MANES_16G005201v8 [Manihot esculenta]|uniref:Uncharacterized protein n=1 Tax=Manihot esculenta TaxID=3983 RepID=A0ACB7G5R5_MANES|nr:hypothetical protein MANES_16G005201v8 [Manihot esculenta]